jgi:hypothetical protein
MIPISVGLVRVKSALMTRLVRMVVSGLPHHVTQRGNRRESIFEINLANSIGIKNELWTLRAPTKSVLAKLRNDDAHWRMNFFCGSR